MKVPPSKVMECPPGNTGYPTKKGPVKTSDSFWFSCPGRDLGFAIGWVGVSVTTGSGVAVACLGGVGVDVPPPAPVVFVTLSNCPLVEFLIAIASRSSSLASRDCAA
jgi:hypothetical protein